MRLVSSQFDLIAKSSLRVRVLIVVRQGTRVLAFA